MTRICITGGPRTGKTTMALWLAMRSHERGCPMGVKPRQGNCTCNPLRLRHTDDLIHLGWSLASERVAKCWLTQPGPWIIEGVAVSRALRKWRDQHPGEPPPVDRVIRLTVPYVELSKGQAAMAKGEETVWQEIEEWIGWAAEEVMPVVVSDGIAMPHLRGRVRFED